MGRGWKEGQKKVSSSLETDMRSSQATKTLHAIPQKLTPALQHQVSLPALFLLN